jgi:protein-disulfide isomerase
MANSTPSQPDGVSQAVNPLRLIALGILGLLMVVIVGAVIVRLVRSSVAGSAATGGAADLQALADGKALGSTSARVTVEEYADFQCPYCQEFHNTTEGQLVQQYVKTGQVRFVYHHFVIIDANTGGHESERSAEASECAGAQGKFWPYHDTLFAHQAREGSGAFSDARLLGFAQSVGLDLTAFNECFSSGQTAAAVHADMTKGLALGVQGTPTVFVNGVQVPNPLNYSSFKTMIETALAHSS